MLLEATISIWHYELLALKIFYCKGFWHLIIGLAYCWYPSKLLMDWCLSFLFFNFIPVFWTWLWCMSIHMFICQFSVHINKHVAFQQSHQLNAWHAMFVKDSAAKFFCYSSYELDWIKMSFILKVLLVKNGWQDIWSCLMRGIPSFSSFSSIVSYTSIIGFIFLILLIAFLAGLFCFFCLIT